MMVPKTFTKKMTKIHLDDPEALCTDGSDAAYYYEEGAKDRDRNSTTWLVYLEGGGWCWDEFSCSVRCKPNKNFPWCSSKLWTSHQDIPAALFLVESNPVLKHAHKIFLKYCSSDAFMGNGEAHGLQFRGAKIVEAVFKDLVKKHKLGHPLGGSNEHLVVFGGESAGARGAMVHLDSVLDYIGKVPSKVKVVGFLDSPLWIDLPPETNKFVGFRKSCRFVYAMANTTSVLGSDCLAAHPPPNEFKCIMAQYRMPWIKTPYFLIASQFDSFQVSNNIGRMDPQDADMEHIFRFRDRTLQLARDLAMPSTLGGKQARQISIVQPACYSHARTGLVWGLSKDAVDGVKVLTAFEEFLEHVKTDDKWSKIIKDKCTSFSCGKGCPDQEYEAMLMWTGGTCRGASARLAALASTLIFAVRFAHVP